MTKSKLGNDFILQEVIQLSQDGNYQDVTIICSNGTFQSNIFVLAAIFPVLRNILDTLGHSDEPSVIFIPNLDKTELDTFFQSIYSESSILYFCKDIKDLMQPVGTAIKDEEFNIKEYVVDIPTVVVSNNSIQDVHDECIGNIEVTEHGGDEKDDISGSGEKQEGFDHPDPVHYDEGVNNLDYSDSEAAAPHYELVGKGKHKNSPHEIKFTGINFPCKECGKVFDSDKNRYNHIRSVHKLFHTSCHICGKHFSNKKKLANHIPFVHSTRECEICKQEIKYGSYRRHKMICKGSYNCSDCDFKTNIKGELQKHRERENHKEMYKCNLCDFETIYLSNMNTHKKTTHAIKFKCDECKKEFRTKETFKRHKLSHSKKFVCEICDKHFCFKVSLDRHILKIHTNGERKVIKVKKHCCQECDYKTDKRANLKRHQEIHIKGKNKAFHIIRKCFECSFIADNKIDMRKHLKMEHSIEVDQLKSIRKSTIHYQCDQCDYNYNYPRPSSRKMRNHIAKMHSPNSQPCYICGVIPLSKMALDKHILSHGQTKCDICKKCFSKDSFDRHKCEVKKFVCNFCGKVFASSTSLIKHNRVVHEKQKLPRNHICHQCDHKFVTMSELKKHLESHEEKTSCPHCGIKVRRLTLHIQAVHTPDEMKKHQCQDCDKGFIDARKLKIHQMNVHLKLRPYNCRYGCDMAYNDTSNRNQHEKRTHGKLFTHVKYENIQEIL